MWFSWMALAKKLACELFDLSLSKMTVPSSEISDTRVSVATLIFFNISAIHGYASGIDGSSKN